MRSRTGTFLRHTLLGAVFVTPFIGLAYRIANNSDDMDFDDDYLAGTSPYLDNFGFHHNRVLKTEDIDYTSANNTLDVDDECDDDVESELADNLSDYLIPEFLKPKTPYTDAFIAELVYDLQEYGVSCMSQDKVEQLARRALVSGRAIELDMLARYYPAYLTEEFFENELSTGHYPAETYTQLLRARAQGHIVALEFLFNPENELVIVEEDDLVGLDRARKEGNTEKIVVTNTEPYEPRARILVLQDRFRTNDFMPREPIARNPATMFSSSRAQVDLNRQGLDQLDHRESIAQRMA